MDLGCPTPLGASLLGGGGPCAILRPTPPPVRAGGALLISRPGGSGAGSGTAETGCHQREPAPLSAAGAEAAQRAPRPKGSGEAANEAETPFQSPDTGGLATPASPTQRPLQTAEYVSPDAVSSGFHSVDVQGVNELVETESARVIRAMSLQTHDLTRQLEAASARRSSQNSRRSAGTGSTSSTALREELRRSSHTMHN